MYVYWLADLFGWDSNDGGSPDDLLRELEVGRKVMRWERLENESQDWYFTALASH